MPFFICFLWSSNAKTYSLGKGLQSQEKKSLPEQQKSQVYRTSNYKAASVEKPKLEAKQSCFKFLLVLWKQNMQILQLTKKNLEKPNSKKNLIVGGIIHRNNLLTISA